MKKVILVKKDPNKPAGADNWIVMNSYEFAMFMKTSEGKKRRPNFGVLEGCDQNDVIIIAECGEESAREWQSELNRNHYIKNRNERHGIVVLSFPDYSTLSGDNLDGEDHLRDKGLSVEDTVIIRLMREKLRVAVMSLSTEERDLIEKMFLAENPMTELEYAECLGLERHQINYRKKQVLKKLRRMLGD